MSEGNEGTKDVSQLCSCIGWTTRHYLIPALKTVLCVPVTYMIPCGTARASTSDAKKDGKSSLGQGNLRITEEMLLKANKKVDAIVQESIGILNGVPVLIEGPMWTEHAKASGLSLSIPLLDQLTGTEFRKRATEQVSEVLLSTLDRESCHESNTRAESQTDLFYPPGTYSQSVADDLVGDVIDCITEDSGQNVHAAAYDVVGYVVEGMKDLVETTRIMGGVSMRRIYATTQIMFNTIQSAVRKLFSRSIYSDSKEEKTMASARHVISQVILSMQCELSALKSAEDLEQIALTQKILSALLSEVRMIGMETKKDRSQSPQPPLLHFLKTVSHSEIEDLTKLHGTPAPPLVAINMEDSSLSPACACEAINQVVDSVIKCERSEGLVPIPNRPEKFISESKMRASSTTNSKIALPHIFDLPQNSECEAVIFPSHLCLSESNKNDYASLVSMLVIRLLKKVDSLRTSSTHQDGVADKVLDISRQLIQKILCELDKSFGIPRDESHPQQVNFHLMYRNVYKDLIREFGSEDVLFSALQSQDPSFESSLVLKLTGEIVKTCSQTNLAASAPLPPIEAVTGLQEIDREKVKKKMTPSWLKMPTFKWKKSKNGAHSVLDSEGSLVASTSSSHVQAMKTELRETLAEVTKAPECAAGRLEMAQEEETTGCCLFRMPRFKFSFKKIMRGAKVGHYDNVTSFEEQNSNVPACAPSSCETQLNEEPSAELTSSVGLTKQD